RSVDGGLDWFSSRVCDVHYDSTYCGAAEPKSTLIAPGARCGGAGCGPCLSGGALCSAADVEQIGKRACGGSEPHTRSRRVDPYHRHFDDFQPGGLCQRDHLDVEGEAIDLLALDDRQQRRAAEELEAALG